jgi:hypothetical protein
MKTHHFSDDELVDILNGTGLRSVVMRSTSHDHDRIDLLIAHVAGSSYRFERDARGGTHLLHVSPCDLKLLASGSLEDCLRDFIPRFPA